MRISLLQEPNTSQRKTHPTMDGFRKEKDMQPGETDQELFSPDSLFCVNNADFAIVKG
jgi:hypothetical protein